MKWRILKCKFVDQMQKTRELWYLIKMISTYLKLILIKHIARDTWAENVTKVWTLNISFSQTQRHYYFVLYTIYKFCLQMLKYILYVIWICSCQRFDFIHLYPARGSGISSFMIWPEVNVNLCIELARGLVHLHIAIILLYQSIVFATNS